MVPGTLADAVAAAVGLASTLGVVALAGSLPYTLATVLFVTALAAGSLGGLLLSPASGLEVGARGAGPTNTAPSRATGRRSGPLRWGAVALLSLSLGCFLAFGVQAVA